ncbi:MAG: protein kinase domain-containing protein, partial [Chthoniobacterales bacterium]
MQTRWERVQEIFLAALEHQPETRSGFVDASCGESKTTYEEVATLLRAHDEAAQFIEQPALPLSAASLLDEFGELPPGQTIGGYTIRALLGSGGMGEVYLAKDNQLGREVAIKLIKRGFASANVVRQFRREERILAALNHPNIARLYGGALTDEGMPYFVMEYVAGERLDDYCQQRHLSLPQRLELFRKICAAVSYAHQRLVIHRDLKPANIRVTAEGEPKLLDFGIAKLLEGDSTCAPDQTITLPRAMTPDYASPEQTRGEPMTTATDVYSLGVVLYQLLTGSKPYAMGDRTPEEMVQVVREQEPTLPSSAVASASGQSGAGWKPAPHLLRGDLDNIALMAMRKEPARRYPSVERFSEDVRRYLEGRPVLARKDTVSYRTAKFVRRNRLPLAAGVLITLSLLGGIIATTWQAGTARQEKAKAQSVNEFLEQMISYSNPYLDSSRKDGHATTMTEVLDAAARRLERKDFVQQPELKAELERIIGASYYGQGRAKLADEHMQNYVLLASTLYAPEDPRLLPALISRAALLFGKGDLLASERLYRQILPRLREGFQKGKVRPIDLADALNSFAYLRRTQGDSHEAELLFREMLAISPQLPVESRFIAEIHRSTLASTLADEGKFDEALQTAREAIAAAQRAGHTDTPGFGFSLTVLGGFLTDQRSFN